MDLSELITSRGRVKSKVTRFERYLNKLSDQADPTELRLRLASYEGVLREFDELQSQIELLQPSTEHANERETFENNYFRLAATATMFIKAKEAVQIESSSQVPLQQSTNPPSGENLIATTSVKLPVIDIPKFSGDYNEWLPFYDAFTSLIHTNNTLNDIQRFQYLKSTLSGDASKLIEYLTVSAGNYSIAWSMIAERYNNPRMLIQGQVNIILNLPGVSSNSYISLRQLVDSFNSSSESLRRLGQPVDSWDAILIPIVTSRFDFATRREWEGSLKTNEFPTVRNLKDFLVQRCRVLENLHVHKVSDKPQHTNTLKTQSYKHPIKSVNVSVKAQRCLVCKEQHLIYSCAALQKLPVMQRINTIKSLNLCTNCLRENHKASQCHNGQCKLCQKRHHTILHLPRDTWNEAAEVSESSSQTVSSVSNYCYQQQPSSQVLLSTFIINIYDRNNKLHKCRGLLDVGSQSNFISQQLCQQLGLKPKTIHIPISGINGTVSSITQSVHIHIQSLFSSFSSKVNCFILPRITEYLPLTTFSVNNIHIPQKIKLADPQFYVSRAVDLLLGAELFWELLCVGQIQVSKDQPRFQKTLLGWIAGGVLSNKKFSESTVCAHSMQSLQYLEKQVSRFWELEEPTELIGSFEQNECEQYFCATTIRNATGRFCVQLPFKSNAVKLGLSRELAIKRFYSLERRFQRHSEIKDRYCQFMHDYLQLGHMEIVPVSQLHNTSNVFYLPHHAVLREHSSTTKLRVVFDGSFKTSNSVSLNDILSSGPTLQQELFTILLRFRIHQFVLCADIKQMYRQIQLSQSHRDFHRIVWRANSNDVLQTYRLTTVTYGVTSAPYLAIRCLQEIARIEGKEYPIAQSAILNDFYVDDLITGSNTQQEIILLAKQITEILAKGEFEMHKFSSNDAHVLSVLNEQKTDLSNVNLDKQLKKILGIGWNQEDDTLKYSIEQEKLTLKITKRTILSTLSQFFDPLGLIAPVLVLAKIMIQKLWSLKLAWDEAVPQGIHQSWSQLLSHISSLNKLDIPRKVIANSRCQTIEIHAFCDASESAYGTCIYVKTVDDVGHSNVNLLCAKSRVAPLRSVTLPRLELCGAVLLARLLHKILNNIKIDINKVYCWTDSTIVLTWIAGSSNSWKTFVNHRVAEIQNLTRVENWYHVRSEHNPADIVSRGILPQQLINLKLWWNGPAWLSQSSERYPYKQATVVQDAVLLEKRQACLVISKTPRIELLYKFSKFTTLERVMAFCLRFLHNLRYPRNKNAGRLKTIELRQATNTIVRLVQEEVFFSEMQALSKGNLISSSSKLLSLNPFLDSEGFLRVGGRLTNANIAVDKKHPMVLPSNHHVTKLLIQHEHVRQLHAGSQSTLSSLRQRFWPLNGRSTVRGILKKCIACFRARPPVIEQLMGNLPISRVMPSRPFLKSGVDYGGPIFIKEGRGRGRRSIKSYIVLFICLVTKAIHIELVYDCTSESFLYALKRFIARRGRPSDVYSDNGSTFVGANNELKALKELFVTDRFKNNVIDTLSVDQIQWHFIPPNAPHFGGIWEAGIKAVKHHIKRVINNAQLTYDEMYSVLTQIESCLNSRPITVLSNDPNDPTALTPGHFLIGSPLNSIPEPDLISLNENRLSRWQRVQQLVQHFWTRWSKEYLTQLHQRTKWNHPTTWSSINGRVAVIRDDNAPPLSWRLARIIDEHPGKDQLIRVVTLKTKDGIVKRPTTKISLLPNGDDDRADK